jgi:catechol 2,3-dioxygenase-like lactoylglutathione lyase family enzyme
MSRLQLALNVSDLDEAIDFYSRYFGLQPAKVQPGYANFAIDEPPLKLILMQGTGAPGSINHFGVEVFSSEEVKAKTALLSAEGFAVEVEESTTCCYAVQDKVWVDGPDGTSWETYVVLADADVIAPGDGSCCATTASGATRCC